VPVVSAFVRLTAIPSNSSKERRITRRSRQVASRAVAKGKKVSNFFIVFLCDLLRCAGPAADDGATTDDGSVAARHGRGAAGAPPTVELEKEKTFFFPFAFFFQQRSALFGDFTLFFPHFFLPLVSPLCQPVAVVVGNQFREVPVACTCQFCHNQIVTSTQYVNGTMSWVACLGLCFVGCSLGCCFIPFW
jgi:hypothetical protein